MTRRSKGGRGSIKKPTVPPNNEIPPCIHIEKSITPSKVKNNFPHAVFGRCSECAMKERILLCLKCGKQFCAPHSDIHTDTNNHSLTYELANGTVRCSKCARELEHSTHSAIAGVVNVIADLIRKQNVPVVRVEPPSPTNTEKPENKSNGVVEQPSPVTEPHIKGLKNSGVICFFNSVLQNLIQTPMLRAAIEYSADGYAEQLRSERYGSVNVKVAGVSGNGMSHKYYSFLRMQDSKERCRAAYPYQIFQEMCSYNESLSDGQQDAQEAYHAIVHSISSEESRRRKNAVLQHFGCVRTTFKELTREKKKKIQEFANLSRNDTFVDQLFGGSTINQITCLTCSSVTKTKDHFVDLSVPLPKKGEFKFRKKQASSGSGGPSKHQKKKQQKENRGKGSGKKGKKGKDHADGDTDVPAQQNAPTCTQDTAISPQDTPISPTSPQDIPISPMSSQDTPISPSSSQDTPISPSSPQDTSTDPLHNGHSAENGTGMMEEPLFVEEIKVEIADVYDDENMTEIDIENIAVEEVVSEDPDIPDICNKLDDIIVNMEENPQLKGGVALDPDSDDGSMLCGMFDEDEEDHQVTHGQTNGQLNGQTVQPSAAAVDGLTQMFDDLEIDNTDYGDDTLDACLAQFCREELLTGDNQFSCMNCARQTIDKSSLNVSYAKSTDSSFSDEESSESSDTEEAKIKPIKTDARCRSFLHSLPPILVIHLKRFTQDNRGQLQKDRRRIHYPLELELDKFVLNNTKNKYKLFGIVDHSGSLHRGHYIAYVRKRDTKLDEKFKDKSVPLNSLIKLLGQINAEKSSSDLGKWFCCNDERISEVPLKRVLNADAYLMFYERCSPYS